MKYIAINRSDGGVSVRLILEESPAFKKTGYGKKADLTAAQIEAEVRKWEAKEKTQRLGWTAVSWKFTDDDPRPTIRMFRNAFEVRDGAVEISMPKARAIKTDMVRLERDERLIVEDLAYTRADEQDDNAEKQRIVVGKQALRDLPSTIQPALDAIETPEDLETWQPTWP